ncbi:energy transducer TonB [Longimicrobium terrae]|uniref:TonB family protein n=1 Tax=Longimicrobium terrae TaxID=1639882 RepID=A0A841GWV9_9BACT|nr:energy transducer TonB [Longimicrobium terrae]MBB4635451.1 TonB family protein [Longimicrobium terrae]MBB6069845.1 TonB family protein [Longimicrobium terrae]NNC30951.1 energy transducer TonB [Longimicrobium terrae]NNC32763.1 energy transducer TonB [Longimicrobium terrae]
MNKPFVAALFAAVLTAAPAAAQQAPAAQVYELRSVEIAPRPLNAAEMAALLNSLYPATLRAASVSGTVRVSMIVGTDGTPREAHVLESADSAFNAPTLTAVQTLRFSPAELNDQPVNVRVELPIVWQAPAPAPEPAPVAAAPANLAAPDTTGIYELKDVTVQPRPINVPELQRAMELSYPEALRFAGTTGMVQVRFVVEKDGRTSGATITRSTEIGFNNPTVYSVSALRFSPARVNGRPVRVWVELPIQWQVAR